MKAFIDTITGNYSLRFAAFVGLAFSVGYLVGQFGESKTVVLESRPTTLAELDEQVASFENAFKHHKLKYYDVLHKKPQLPKVAKAQEKEPVAETLVEPKKMQAKAIPEQVASEDVLAQALSKVLGSSAPTPVAEKSKKILPQTTGSAFAIQLASFKTRPQADMLAEKMSSKGHKASVVWGELDDKTLVYRVRIHGFNSKDNAIDYLAKHAPNDTDFQLGFIIEQ